MHLVPRITAFASCLALAAPASAREELNLAGALPPEQTALVRVDQPKRSVFSVGGPMARLVSITDLSAPGAEPVTLFSKWSAKKDRDPRVAPGRYLLHIDCQAPTGLGGYFHKPSSHEIDARAGEVYIVLCTGRTAHRMAATVRKVAGDDAPTAAAPAETSASPAEANDPAPPDGDAPSPPEASDNAPSGADPLPVPPPPANDGEG